MKNMTGSIRGEDFLSEERLYKRRSSKREDATSSTTDQPTTRNHFWEENLDTMKQATRTLAVVAAFLVIYFTSGQLFVAIIL